MLNQTEKDSVTRAATQTKQAKKKPSAGGQAVEKGKEIQAKPAATAKLQDADTPSRGRRPQGNINKNVEQALLRKATGYAYVQQESYKLKNVEYDDATGKKTREWESVQVVELEKHVPPEYSAIALWLKARMPETWGDAAQTVAAEPVVIVDDIPAQTSRLADGAPLDGMGGGQETNGEHDKVRAAQ